MLKAKVIDSLNAIQQFDLAYIHSSVACTVGVFYGVVFDLMFLFEFIPIISFILIGSSSHLSCYIFICHFNIDQEVSNIFINVTETCSSVH